MTEAASAKVLNHAENAKNNSISCNVARVWHDLRSRQQHRTAWTAERIVLTMVAMERNVAGRHLTTTATKINYR